MKASRPLATQALAVVLAVALWLPGPAAAAASAVFHGQTARPVIPAGFSALPQQTISIFSRHISRLAMMSGNPELALSYIQAQKQALSIEPQAAATHAFALNLVARAMDGSYAPVVEALRLSGEEETGRQLETLAQSYQQVRAKAARDSSSAYADLLKATQEVQADTAWAKLYDGASALTSRTSPEVVAPGAGLNAKILAGLKPAGASIRTQSDDGIPDQVRDLFSGMAQNAAARKAAREEAMRKKAIGTDIQAWGLHNVIYLDSKMRYARLYRMNGMPTDLGMALHEVMAPLVAADEAFLSRVTAGQLKEAALQLSESLRYASNPYGDKLSFQKRMALAGGEYDYVEWRQAFMERAKKALTRPAKKGEKSAKLGPVAEERQPAMVMRKALVETMGVFQETAAKVKKGEVPESALEPLMDIIVSLSASMGVPININGQMEILTVQHRQVKPVIDELKRRKVPWAVIRAVMRAFPLGESLNRLGVYQLWSRGLTGKGVKVAVIDNGVDFDHPDFQDVNNSSENLTRDRGAHTKGGHGTPMAAIIHAIAPDAEIQSYQALSNTDLPGVGLNQAESQEAIIKAMDRAAANGANVINISAGFPMGYASDAVSRKITELKGKGIVVIVSAGNEGQELPKGFQVRSPATSPDAIAVGAVDYHGRKAPFSSAGPVFNPADYTIQDRPDIYAFGVNVKTAIRLPAQFYGEEPLPYDYVSGTSPASPHVTGVAALMLQAGKAAGKELQSSVVPAAVRAALISAARRMADLPVLVSAPRAVREFLKLLSAGTPA